MQVSESVPISLSGFAVTLYNKSSVLESSPKKTVLRLGGLTSRVCYFGISAEGAGSGNFIQGKVPHARRVCEVTHFSFLGFFPPLNCLMLPHSGLGAHLHVCGDVRGYEVVTKLALT